MATNIPCSCTIEEPDGTTSGSIVVTGDRCAPERLNVLWRASSLQYQLDFKRNELTHLGTHDQIWNIPRVIRMVRINGKIASGWTKIEVAAGVCEARRLTKSDFVNVHAVCSRR